MVLAEDSAAAGEGVVQEPPGLLIVTQRPQERAEDQAEPSVTGWSSPRIRWLRVKVSFWSCRAC